MTKSLTKFSLAALLGAGAATATHAAPMLSLGEDANLFFNGGASVRYESNVLLTDENEKDDIISVLSPGLEFVMGQENTDLNLRALYRYNASFYTDFNKDNFATPDVDEDLDSGEHEFTMNFVVNSAKVTYTGRASYIESQTNSYEVLNPSAPTEIYAAHVDRAVSTFGFYAEQEYSPKTSLGLGVAGDRYDYDYKDYSDFNSFSVPVDFYYELTPTMDLSLGFRYRKVNTTGTGVDSEDYFYNVGVRKELAPKLTGSLKVGYQDRNPNVSSTSKDQNGLSAMADLVYAATPLTSARPLVDRDFSVTPTSGQGVERTSTSFIGNYLISPVLTATGRVTYVSTDYYESATDRVDDFYSLGVSLTYSPTEYVSVTGGYTFNNNDSDVNSDFTNHILQVSAMLRY